MSVSQSNALLVTAHGFDCRDISEPLPGLGFAYQVFNRSFQNRYQVVRGVLAVNFHLGGSETCQTSSIWRYNSRDRPGAAQTLDCCARCHRGAVNAETVAPCRVMRRGTPSHNRCMGTCSELTSTMWAVLAVLSFKARTHSCKRVQTCPTLQVGVCL
jgi:hypothetical protein